MNTSAEAADQIVRMTLNGTETALKITGAGAERVAKLLYTLLKDLKNETKKTKGHIRLDNLLKEGKKLEVFEIPDTNLKKFCELAKNYGMTYTILKEKNNDSGMTEIMVKSDDSQKLNHIFRRMNINLSSIAEVDNGEEKENSEKQEPERVSLEKTGPDKFLDELMAKDNPTAEKSETENPNQARSENDRSVPSSKNTDHSIDDGERKPSVRAKLDKYKEDIKKAEETAKTVATEKPIVIEHIEVPKRKNIKERG